MPTIIRPTRKIDGYDLGRVLGVGGFGKVFLGVDAKTFKKVAVKVISKEVVRREKLEDYVLREIEIMQTVNHVHVVRLYKSLEDKNSYYLVMELAPNGELFDRIIHDQRFEENVARKYFQQLISALWACHGRGIVHRDLKAENLLIGEHDRLKVCDFGLSRYVASPDQADHPIIFQSVAGSTDYQAPEMIRGGLTGYKGFTCDIWSCGVILFFMLCGYLPFTASSESETRQRIWAAAYNKHERHLSEGARDLISHILVVNPNNRYTIEHIVQHRWFRVDLPPNLIPEEGQPLSPINRSLHPALAGPSPTTGASPTVPNAGAFPGTSKTKEETVLLLEIAFDSCNVDGTGYLDKDQLRDVLIKLNNGEPVPDAEVQSMMHALAFDDTGKLARKGFIKSMLENKTLEGRLELARLVNVFHYEIERDLLRELRSAFNTLDIDNSGLITVQNLGEIAKQNPELQFLETEAARSDLLHALGSPKAVTFERFVQAITRGSVLKSHPGARKLNVMATIFSAQDFHNNTLVNTGFTVAAFREELETKLFEEGKSADFSTTFRFQPQSMFLAALHTSPVDGKQVEIGMQLQPVMTGYTKIFVYRMQGPTPLFHSWFRLLRRVLRKEILQYEEDTTPCGPSELM